MVFFTPQLMGPLSPVPDDVSICDFILEDRHGRTPLRHSKDPFTCGFSKKTYSALDVVERVDSLSRALAKEFNWAPNEGTEWDKVVAVFSVNTVRAEYAVWVR